MPPSKHTTSYQRHSHVAATSELRCYDVHRCVLAVYVKQNQASDVGDTGADEVLCLFV